LRPTTAEPKPLTRCPLCGSKRIRRQRIALRFKDGQIVGDVPADACRACGEQFLDLAAARALDARRRAR
jgi:YgiT-type zinc finger domain-containing protein